MTNLICKFYGHKWNSELGGQWIDTYDGASICYRCGHREIRGDDPAS